jgi:DNA replication protein DnaC
VWKGLCSEISRRMVVEVNDIEQAQHKLQQMRQERGLPEPETMRPIRDPESAVPLPEAMERFLARYTIVEEDRCPKCSGSGWAPIPAPEKKIGYTVVRCECTNTPERRAKSARIPEKYMECSFGSFVVPDIGHPSIGNALFFTQKFAENYPADRKGICLYGGCGGGKTHLAIAMLQEILAKGITGLFVHYPELLHMIRQSYGDDGSETESQVLYPVYNAEVLVLDELGAMKASEWTQEILCLLLNARYNASKTTLVTTNYSPTELRERIGDRAHSRLAEMCRMVVIEAEDFRQKKA